jgi:hypothetical protein
MLIFPRSIEGDEVTKNRASTTLGVYSSEALLLLYPARCKPCLLQRTRLLYSVGFIVIVRGSFITALLYLGCHLAESYNGEICIKLSTSLLIFG